MKKSISQLTCLALLLFAAVASAHELTAPVSTAADGAGHFSFTVMLEVTTPTPNGSAYLDGRDNTNLGEVYFDGFCIAQLAPGFYPQVITGNLVDPGLGGTVVFDHTLCDSWTGSVTVVIMPPAVGVQHLTWSTCKARFR